MILLSDNIEHQKAGGQLKVIPISFPDVSRYIIQRHILNYRKTYPAFEISVLFTIKFLKRWSVNDVTPFDERVNMIWKNTPDKQVHIESTCEY